MRVAVQSPRFLLSQGEMLRIRASRGVEIRCHTGRLWITEEGNPDDAWLAADQRFACARRGLTLVGAELDSVVELLSPQQTEGRTRVRLLASLTSTQLRVSPRTR